MLEAVAQATALRVLSIPAEISGQRVSVIFVRQNKTRDHFGNPILGQTPEILYQDCDLAKIGSLVKIEDETFTILNKSREGLFTRSELERVS